MLIEMQATMKAQWAYSGRWHMFKLWTWSLPLAVTAAIVLVSDFAHGSPILFNSRSSFEAAAGQVDTITFEEFAGGLLCDPRGFGPCSFETRGITFTSTVPNFNPVFQRPMLAIDRFGTARIVSSGIPVAPDQFFLTFSGPFIGFDVLSTSGVGHVVSVILSESDGSQTPITISALPPPPFGAGTFFGAISPIGFQKVSLFSVPSDGVRYNIEIDNVAIIPEPNTLALLGSGLIGMAIFCWKRLKTTPGPRRGEAEAYVKCRDESR